MRSRRFPGPPVSRADYEAEQERHGRRMRLMQMQGDCNRLERRIELLWFWLAVGAFVLVVGAFLTMLAVH